MHTTSLRTCRPPKLVYRYCTKTVYQVTSFWRNTKVLRRDKKTFENQSVIQSLCFYQSLFNLQCFYEILGQIMQDKLKLLLSYNIFELVKY